MEGRGRHGAGSRHCVERPLTSWHRRASCAHQSRRSMCERGTTETIARRARLSRDVIVKLSLPNVRHTGWLELMRRACSILLTTLLLTAAAAAQDAPVTPAAHGPVPVIQAARATGPIVIDGRLDDEAWLRATPATAFIQRDPEEGKPVSEETELRVVYDDRALYVGARLRDREPSRIARQLARRDQEGEADGFSLYLDPHHDHLTGAMFSVSAAGVQSDATIFNDSWNDGTWDAVWGVGDQDRRGWMGRGDADSVLTAALSGGRSPHLRHQCDALHPAEERAGVAGARAEEGERAGVAARPSRRSGGRFSAADVRAPACTWSAAPSSSLRRAIGIRSTTAPGCLRAPASIPRDRFSSNLSLDGTINPDFGQVEVDRAVVNLTAFETFFEEKRPFFIEGANIFGDFGRTGSNNFWGLQPRRAADSLFAAHRAVAAGLSRRRVRRHADRHDDPGRGEGDGEYAQRLEPRDAGGGDRAGIRDNGRRHDARRRRSRAAVELLRWPRAARDWPARCRWRDRDRGEPGPAGAVAARDPAGPVLCRGRPRPFLPRRQARLGDQRSGCRGATCAARPTRSLACSSPRSATSIGRCELRRTGSAASDLDGWTGSINLNRQSGVHMVNAALWGVSPAFDSSDAGFTFKSDRGGMHAVYKWRDQEVKRFSRQRFLAAAKFYTWNYGREVQADGTFLFGNMQFKNYWRVFSDVYYFRATQNDTETRGGPSMLTPNSHRRIDRRGDRQPETSVLRRQLQHEQERLRRLADWQRTQRPPPAVLVAGSLGRPGLLLQPQRRAVRRHLCRSGGRPRRMAPATCSAGSKQRELSIQTRVNYVLSPKMSLQVYMQPLVSVGDYEDSRSWPGRARSTSSATGRIAERCLTMRFARDTQSTLATAAPTSSSTIPTSISNLSDSTPSSDGSGGPARRCTSSGRSSVRSYGPRTFPLRTGHRPHVSGSCGRRADVQDRLLVSALTRVEVSSPASCSHS